MGRKILWGAAAVVVLATGLTLAVMRAKCMDVCVKNFKGAYPEVACKYECSVFNKFKRPVAK